MSVRTRKITLEDQRRAVGAALSRQPRAVRITEGQRRSIVEGTAVRRESFWTRYCGRVVMCAWAAFAFTVAVIHDDLLMAALGGYFATLAVFRPRW